MLAGGDRGVGICDSALKVVAIFGATHPGGGNSSFKSGQRCLTRAEEICDYADQTHSTPFLRVIRVHPL